MDIISEKSESGITWSAEKTSNFPGGMAMINAKTNLVYIWLSTDLAAIYGHLNKLLRRYSVFYL